MQGENWLTGYSALRETMLFSVESLRMDTRRLYGFITNIDAAFVVPKYLIAQFSNKK
jgi:hypothetical protein